MIKIENLYKSYNSRKNFFSRGKQEKIFNGLSVEIPLNKMSAIIGVNGAGKTTLFKILSGYTSFDSVGELTIGKLSHTEYLKNNKIFLISSEDRSFYYRLTLVQNLLFFTNIFKVEVSEKEIIEKLEFLGIAHKKDHFYYELSTGMKQRLSLARALLIKPNMLILDEMERGIDTQMVEKIFDYLDTIKKEITIIYATHQKYLIDKADVVIELKNE